MSQFPVFVTNHWNPSSPVFALEFDLLLPVVSVFLLFSLLAQWSSSVFSQVETRDFQAISRTKRIFKESHPLQLDWWPNGRRKPINLVHNCLFRNAGGVYINVRTLAGLNSLDPIWLKLRFGSLASSPTGLYKRCDVIRGGHGRSCCVSPYFLCAVCWGWGWLSTMNVGQQASVTVHSGSLNDNERNHFKNGPLSLSGGVGQTEIRRPHRLSELAADWDSQQLVSVSTCWTCRSCVTELVKISAQC